MCQYLFSALSLTKYFDPNQVLDISLIKQRKVNAGRCPSMISMSPFHHNSLFSQYCESNNTIAIDPGLFLPLTLNRFNFLLKCQKALERYSWASFHIKCCFMPSHSFSIILYRTESRTLPSGITI